MPPTQRSFLLLVVSCIAYLALELLVGRFAQTDEVFFKAAGLHLATEGRFVAPELEGRLSVGPPLSEVYLAQPPLYTALFGAWTFLVGFGPWHCILFDALIHIAFVLVLRRLCIALAPEVPANLRDGVCALVLLMGTPGRPDELATFFGVCAFLLQLSDAHRVPRALCVGACLGLALATSAGAAVLAGLLGLSWCVVHYQRTDFDMAQLILTGAASVAVPALGVVPILWGHPDAWLQYTTHASEQGAAMRWLFSNGDLQSLISVVDSFLFAWRYGKAYVGLAAACAFSILAARVLLDRLQGPLRGVGLGLTTALAWLVAMFPGKYLYLWMVSPWLIAAALQAVHALWAKGGAARLVALPLLVGGVMGITPYARTKVSLLAAPAGQDLANNTRQVKELMPEGARVVTLEGWWMIGDKCRVRDPLFSKQPLDTVDAIIQTGNGSGSPGVPGGLSPALDEYAKDHFTLLHDNLNRTPLSFRGRVLTNSAYGFGTYIRARPGLVPAPPTP